MPIEDYNITEEDLDAEYDSIPEVD